MRPRRNRRCAAAFERAIGPEPARPRNGGAVFPDASRPRKILAWIATDAGYFSDEENEPRCAVLRFAAALRLRLRVQATRRSRRGDRHEGRVCRAAKPSEDPAHDDQPLLT